VVILLLFVLLFLFFVLNPIFNQNPFSMKPSLFFRNHKQVCLVSVFMLASFFSKAQVPLNDNPASAFLPAFTLTPAASCSNTNGTMVNATITPEVANATLLSGNISPFSCATNNFRFDVYYSFTATSSNHTITLSNNSGANFNQRQMVVYQTNTLTTFSAVTCTAVQAGTGNLTLAFTDYSPGTTYLIRVIHASVVNTPVTLNGGFRICVTTGTNNVVQPVLSGKSYTNITRPLGGTVQTGDVLEFRNSINVADWSVSNGSIYNTTFHDTIPAGLSYVANSIKFETNEGLQFESGITGTTNLTDASGDDEAVYNGGVLRVNVGSLPREGASTVANRQLVYQGSPAVTPITYASAGGGKIHARGRPSQFAQYVVIVVRYQVTVTAATGTTFTTSNGQYRYKTTTSSVNDIAFPQTSINFPRYTVYVSEAGTSLCQGGTGSIALIDSFGRGNTTHDSTQLTIAPGYTWKPFATGAPQDGEFAVINNTSAVGSYTNKYAPFPSTSPQYRVHQVWDIIGDHTGASNLDSGNLAVSRGTNGGYMGVVNAAFGINTAIQKNITGLCTDTYYEFSAWFKNICAGCSTDSAGRGMSAGALFKPYLATKTLNDSAGVSPDLTYTIDGVDYYTTGSIPYDRRWVKKGFLFKTGSSGSVTLTIRNNAPGGGGNDWAIDDIALTTCFPSMTYSPSAAPNICEGNPLNITDTVRYLYNNYVKYKWQIWPAATSGPWTDISGASGTGMPVWNGTQYEYVASYNIPNTMTLPVNDGDRYRLVVASNATNLSSSTCSYSDPTIINLNVLTNCPPILASDLISINGKLTNSFAKITWVVVTEEKDVKYQIERSDDGVSFYKAGTIAGGSNPNLDKQYYNFDDAKPVIGSAWYRIGVVSDNGVIRKYSKTILLKALFNHNWSLGSVVNPFNNELQFEISTPNSAIAKIELLDNTGKLVRQYSRQINTGVNGLSIHDVGNLSKGIYLLRVIIDQKMESRKIYKPAN
jgi:trimeric autotransporter adhesin